MKPINKRKNTANEIDKNRSKTILNILTHYLVDHLIER